MSPRRNPPPTQKPTTRGNGSQGAGSRSEGSRSKGGPPQGHAAVPPGGRAIRYGPRLGIDTGGTFTDVVRRNGKRLWVGKVPSTPADPGEAVVAAMAHALTHGNPTAQRRTADPATPDVVHGSTVALNAILTGNLARVVWITNAGFEDLIEIGRQDRSDLYALEPSRPEPPVPRPLRIGVTARRGPGGRVIRRFLKGELAQLKARVARLKPEAIAIGLLHSTEDPADEHRIRAALRGLKVPVTCSADVSQEPNEFERFVTAILNAAVAPIMGSYLDRLVPRVAPGRLRMLASDRGIVKEDQFAEQPIQAVFSGPAGGVLASEAFATANGFPQVAALDMGGTSTDVCLVGDRGAAVELPSIKGLPLGIPAADLHTIGCGGGSLAIADGGGALQVGPQSAGAVPGPACYGVGDQPTVTDAHVALGHLGAGTLLGGEFPIDPDRSVRAVETLAQQLGHTPRGTAEGILKIAQLHMARAVLVITAARAVDPADVPLLAYGGAGGLHAVELAKAVGHSSAWVPHAPGCFSAVGLALAGEALELRETLHLTFQHQPPAELSRRAKELGQSVRDQLGVGRCRVEVSGLLRYHGQGGCLAVPFPRAVSPRDLRARFEEEHQRVFGFLTPGRAVEVVQLRAAAWQPPAPLPEVIGTQSAEIHRDRKGGPTPTGFRRPPLGGQRVAIYLRGQLAPGDIVHGPASIEETTGTTWLPPGESLTSTPTGLRWQPA